MARAATARATPARAAAREDAPKHDRELDVRGLNCPLPALRARSALARMKSGEVLRVVATDRGAPRDFELFARNTGHRLVARSSSRREFVFYLRKA